ncbi:MULTISPECIES: hypothetical protein [Streptomyces]|uniref:Uncharacterized protein n=1 Tax=Streptomyces silvae TaxID=2803812 RepID=A0ABU7ZUI8_9ACTN|nr:MULTISPECIES: hypothetical protein [unclassified Streptomyces]MDX3326920.1 hypothetical protein [Streptomyces sp. ME02-6979-3A]MDX3433553.1 hypothetical protein [Streptomyces sp. ME01-18a]MDX3688543.1 hypothetical protein [Streptomyces sp. AK04-4c]
MKLLVVVLVLRGFKMRKLWSRPHSSGQARRSASGGYLSPVLMDLK